jgi:hypothetical protein
MNCLTFGAVVEEISNHFLTQSKVLHDRDVCQLELAQPANQHVLRLQMNVEKVALFLHIQPFFQIDRVGEYFARGAIQQFWVTD